MDTFTRKSGAFGATVMSAMILFAGCASTVEKNVELKLAEEGTVEDRRELQDKANELIATTPGLSQDQRTRLEDLMESSNSKMDSLVQESLRLRSVLIKEMFAPSYNAKEVKLIEAKLRKVERQRLSLMLDTVSKTDWIFGRANTNANGTSAAPRGVHEDRASTRIE